MSATKSRVLPLSLSLSRTHAHHFCLVTACGWERRRLVSIVSIKKDHIGQRPAMMDDYLKVWQVLGWWGSATSLCQVLCVCVCERESKRERACESLSLLLSANHFLWVYEALSLSLPLSASCFRIYVYVCVCVCVCVLVREIAPQPTSIHTNISPCFLSQAPSFLSPAFFS